MAPISGPIRLISTKTDPLIIGQETFRSSKDFSLNEFDKEKARREINETEDKKRECLENLKARLSKEKVKYRTDDDYLLRYLRYRKYNCNETFKTIKTFYSKREKYADIFSLPSNLDMLLNVGFASCLPYLDEDGCVLLQLHFDKWDPNYSSLKELLCAGMAMCDIVTVNPHCQINGIKCIWDVGGLSLRQLPQLLSFSAFMVSLLQDCFPWRIQQIVGINGSFVQQEIYKLLRHFVKKKVYERIKLLGSDYSELHKLFNPALLPKAYGGAIEESDYNITQYILDNLPYITYERSFGYEKNN